MGFTLDQLLETTGVDELTGAPLRKEASEVPLDLLKLASRCRLAADTEDEPLPAAELVDQKDLVEKTAAVAIIRRTIEEIREIDGYAHGPTKTASDNAAFIKSALEQGHSAEDIARFLEDSEDKKRPEKKKVATSIIS